MKFYKRDFLNVDEGIAAFEANVEWDEKYPTGIICANFKISDCNRQVCLDFDVYDNDCYVNASYKLDKLIKELQHFSTVLKTAVGDRDAVVIEQRLGECV